MTPSTPRYLSMFLLGCAVLGIASLDAAAQAPKTEVIFTQAIEGFLYGPIYIARAKGYFDEEGIKPTVIISGGGSKAMSAMVSGAAQAYVGAPTEVVNARHAGLKVVSWALLMDELPVSLVIRQDVARRVGITEKASIIDKAKAMKGLTMGVSSAKSGGETLFRYVLSLAKLDPDKGDAKIVAVGAGPSAVAAFTAGKVDMLAYSSPVREQAAARGPGFDLIDFARGDVPVYVGFPFVSLISREDWLDANPEVAKGVVRALAKAEKLLRERPDEAKEIFRTFFSTLEPDLFEASFKGNMPCYSPTPAIDPAKFQQAIQEFKDTRPNEPMKLTVDEIATNKWVKAASAK